MIVKPNIHRSTANQGNQAFYNYNFFLSKLKVRRWMLGVQLLDASRLLLPATAWKRFGKSLGLLALVFLISCSSSRPPAPPGTKSPPAYMLKFVPYSHNNALVGYFTLADAATNQIASAGQLRIQIYSFTGLTMGSTGNSIRLKRVLYDNTLSIGISNFHWETYGTFFTVDDLACRFMVPYEHFQAPVRHGKVAMVQIDFRADNGTNEFTARQNVSLY